MVSRCSPKRLVIVLLHKRHPISKMWFLNLFVSPRLSCTASATIAGFFSDYRKVHASRALFEHSKKLATDLF
jgi:hypothetical protein